MRLQSDIIINQTYNSWYWTAFISISGGSDGRQYIVMADSACWWWVGVREEISVPGVGEELGAKLSHEVGVVIRER